MLDTSPLDLTTPHPIWTAAGSNPVSVRKATVVTWLLPNVYRTGERLFKMKKIRSSACILWAVTHLLSCGQVSAREKILSGYVGLLARLQKSASWEIRNLADFELHDASSVTGVNIAEIKKEFGSDPRLISPREMKQLVRVNRAPVDPEEDWKISILEEMLCERQERLEEGEEGHEIELLTSYCEIICTI